MYLRILITILPDATNYFSPLIQTIAVITLIYSSLATIVQQDTKRLIAYSSIGHIGPKYLTNNEILSLNVLHQTICRKLKLIKIKFITNFTCG